jgi:tetratricopeptide (TPR) repeat protein
MNELTLQGLNHAYSKFDADNFDDAVEELRSLAATVSDPWEKAELLYHESMFLLESNKIVEARQRVTELAEALAMLVPSPSDGYEYDVPITLPVMACHANLKVTAKEGKTLEALRLIEDLITRYPKQLSIPQFQMMFDEVKTLRGVLLGNARRWAEAKPYLEEATPPETWRGYHLYYLGLCYYELGDNLRAKQKLSEALDVGLEGAWEVRAHLNLGFAEYKLSNMEAAKRQFEICVKSPDQQSIDMQIVWEGLEATARALGLVTEAENYKRLRIAGPSKPRIDQ